MKLPGQNTKQANDPVAKIVVDVDQAYVSGSSKGYRSDYSDGVKGDSKGGVNGK
jgi:hypothetical protein